MKRICAVFPLLASVLGAADFQIPIEKYKLNNGLRVILSRDSAAPVMACYIIYDVGARVEEKGRTGFAHLFEHMMFQGSANAPKGLHFKTVESNGGVLNGSTHPDFTDYFEILPSNKLPVALFLESDRMRSLAITKETLANQKEAVKQERRLSFDNQPYATAIVDRWPQLAYKNFQNYHSLIGSFEDLNAATVDDVARFFKTYYAPNNAVLVIVGDFEPAQAKRLIEGYFGDIPAQPQPKHPDLTEPPITEARSTVYKDPLAKVPQLLIGYPGPVRRSADYNAMVMLDAVLTGGESSRFALNLIKGKQSLLGYEANLGWPFAGPSDYKNPGLYAMGLTHNPRFTGKQVLAQAEEEFRKIIDNGIPEKELARVRNLLRASQIKGLQSTMRRATLLGQYEILDGKPEYINSEIDEFLKVTASQIQAAAKKYLDPSKRITMEIVPAPPSNKENK